MELKIKEYSFSETIRVSMNMYFSSIGKVFLVMIAVFAPLMAVLAFFLDDLKVLLLDNGEIDFENPVIYIYLVLSVYVAVAFVYIDIFITRLLECKALKKEYTSMELLKESLGDLLPAVLMNFILLLIVALGTILFIIPGIIAAMGFYVATQSLVLEKRKPIDALKRSWNLTKDKKFFIFGLNFVISWIFTTVFYILIFIMIFVGVIIAGIFTADDTAMFLITFIMSYLSFALYIPFWSILKEAIYFSLKVEKESYQFDLLVDDFTNADQKVSDGKALY